MINFRNTFIEPGELSSQSKEIDSTICIYVITQHRNHTTMDAEKYNQAMEVAKKLTVQIFETLEKDTSEAKVQSYYTGESDSNQETFEQLTSQNLLCVSARSSREAGLLFAVLRLIIDENPYPMLSAYDDDDKEGGDVIDRISRWEDVGTKPNRPIDGSTLLGSSLSNLINSDTAPVTMGLAQVRGAFTRFK